VAFSTFIVAALFSVSLQPPAGHAGGHGDIGSTSMRGSGVILDTAPERDQATQDGTNAHGERLICRRIESSTNRTGSRRVCLSAREWRARQN